MRVTDGEDEVDNDEQQYSQLFDAHLVTLVQSPRTTHTHTLVFLRRQKTNERQVPITHS